MERIFIIVAPPGLDAVWQEAERPSFGWAEVAALVPQGWKHESNYSNLWKEKEAKKTAWL